MSHLGNILPPSPDQIRATERITRISEKPIKELLFAYFKLYENVHGPRYSKYTRVLANIRDLNGLVGPDSFYYCPPIGPGIQEEICVQVPSTWNIWEFQPEVVPIASVWDEDGAIASLSEPERARANNAVGQILHNVQITWAILASRCPEMQGLELTVQSSNLVLKLVDKGKASKSDDFSNCIGVKISVKDKIEINNGQIQNTTDHE